jgi:hypothetical protein
MATDTDNFDGDTVMVDFPEPSEFRKWLKSRDPNEVIADNWSCYTCPLAVWLSAAGVGDAPYIRPSMPINLSCWRPSDEGVNAELPAWANQFAVAVDSLKTLDNGRFGPVTATFALALLDEILSAEDAL